jgi:SAM-dependent methyltransferase
LFPSEIFHLVVALGIYHNARSRDEWERSLEETVRVLKPGGRLLVSNFSPRCDPAGTGLSEVACEPNVYEGFGSGRHYFVEADQLDHELDRLGLFPAFPTETVMKKTENGQRVTVNGLYLKRGR